MNDVDNLIRNIEYVIKEIKDHNRPVKDMDLTIRLWSVLKYLEEHNEELKAKSGVFM
tara:strand:+ start:617 stop:787 length:171 start_codon:yes stop_codon:yes gene_type:complete